MGLDPSGLGVTGLPLTTYYIRTFDHGPARVSTDPLAYEDGSSAYRLVARRMAAEESSAVATESVGCRCPSSLLKAGYPVSLHLAGPWNGGLRHHWDGDWFQEDYCGGTAQSPSPRSV